MYDSSRIRIQPNLQKQNKTNKKEMKEQSVIFSCCVFVNAQQRNYCYVQHSVYKRKRIGAIIIVAREWNMTKIDDESDCMCVFVWHIERASSSIAMNMNKQ